MNNIKTIFAISDLENLTGIKAHTIRIWEKRYSVLTPQRGMNNLRSYSLDDLRKLLNIAILVEYGIKISRVARMEDAEIETMVKELRTVKQEITHTLHQYKLSMMTFDQALFMETTDQLLCRMNFSEVFMGYFLPLLDEVGHMWQTATIQPAHEHFISNLIRMCILQHTAVISRKIKKRLLPSFVLFLPLGEIHELGLLYLQYEIAASGNTSIYLGSNIPLDGLSEVSKLFTNVIYVTYLTLLPEEKPLNEYIQALERKVKHVDSKLWVIGRRVSEITIPDSDTLRFFASMQAAINELS